MPHSYLDTIAHPRPEHPARASRMPDHGSSASRLALRGRAAPGTAHGTAYHRRAPRLLVAGLAMASAAIAAGCDAADPVEPPVPTSVELTLSAEDVWEAASAPITAVVRDQYGDALNAPYITWTSSDSTVATARYAQVYARRPGVATLTARHGSVVGAITLTVRPDDVERIDIAAPQDSIVVGRTIGVATSIRGVRGGVLEGRPVRWESEAPEIAAIGADGELRGLSIGTARIHAITGERAASIVVRVVPVPVASVVLTLADTVLALGARTVFTATALAEDGTPMLDRPVTVRPLDSRFLQMEGREVIAVGSGTAVLEASAGGRTATATLQVTRSAAEPWTPELVFTPDATAEDRAFVRKAVERWQRVILAPAPVPPSPTTLPAGACGKGQTQPIQGEIIHQLRVYVQFDSIDGRGGAVAAAGPCVVAREHGPYSQGQAHPGMQRPVVGIVTVDTSDLRHGTFGSDAWHDIMVHEIGHVLGIGTFWHSDHFITDRQGSAPRFVGQRGARAYHQLGGAEIGIPVETGGGPGTTGAHWAEPVFRSEVMTGWVGGGLNPLSTLTLGALADFGWSVDYGAADLYTIPSSLSSLLMEGSAHQLIDHVLLPRHELSGGRTTRIDAGAPRRP